MKLFLVFALFCLWASVHAVSNRCSYDFCHKEELSGCRKDDKITREQCNNQGNLSFKK